MKNKLKPFTRSKVDRREMSRSVDYAVHGFWPNNTVTVSQRRSWLDGGGWGQADVGWSCGGREPSREPDGLVAAECFAKAVADAVKLARKWTEKPPKR